MFLFDLCADCGCSAGGDPMPACAVSFLPTACGYRLAGAKVAITGPVTVELTTGNVGVTWNPTATGSYTYTITHASGRLAPFSGAFTVSLPCSTKSFSPTLAPAAGYTCCRYLTDGDGNRLPISNTLRATTSGGYSWDFTACLSTACVLSDDVQRGPEAVTNSDYAPCTYKVEPTLTSGRVPMWIQIDLSFSPALSTRLTQIRPPWDKVVRYDSMSALRCSQKSYLNGGCPPLTFPGSGNPDVTVKTWYTGEACTTYPNSDVGPFRTGPEARNGTATIVSQIPFLATFAFPDVGPGSAWSATGPYYEACAIRGNYPPVPIASVTVAEVLP